MSEKYVYGKKSTVPVSEEKTSLLFWLIAGIATLFLFWAPFQKALFNGNTIDFERPIYNSLVWGFIVLFIASIYFFYNWKLRDHRDILSLLIWLLPLTFLLSKISEASHYYATNMVYIQMLYAIFFTLGIYLCRGSIGNKVLTYSVMGSGYAVVWFGILNWIGYKEPAAKMIQWFVELPNKSEYKDAVMSAENQLRLTSTFQYANSYAAFLIALLLGAVYLIVTSKKPQSIFVNAFMLVPIIISFFLTISRGGLVVLPIIILLILPFMKLTKQIFFFIYLGLAFLISLLILGKITIIGEQTFLNQDLSSASEGLWILIGVSVLCAAIIWLLKRFVYPMVEQKLSTKIKIKFANIILPAAALIIGSLGIFLLFGNTGATKLLPEYMKNRVESINFNQHSVLERGTFYKDSMKLFNDYPIIGAGGGAWAALYEKYQNNPYVSRQAHNFFIQYLVETGLVGIIILIGLLFYLFSLYIRQQLRAQENSPDRHLFYIVTISLLVHSIIDFDLSYVFLGILVFLSLGAMISHTTISLNLSFLKNGTPSYVNKIYPSILLLLSIIMFFNSAQNLNANSLYRSSVAATNNNKQLNDIFTPLNKALDIRENHPDYTLFKISLLSQLYQQSKDEKYYTEMMNVINQLKTSEPHNRYLVEQETQAYLAKNDFAKAQELTNAQINNFPWDITLYERSIELDMQLAEIARAKKDETSKIQYWNHASTVHNKVLTKMKELEHLPKEQVQGRPFNVTRNMALRLGQMEYIRGQYDSAIAFFKMHITDQFDDPANREFARWYLASLQKQNKSDQALLDKLVAKDPKERDELTRLINATF